MNKKDKINILCVSKDSLLRDTIIEYLPDENYEIIYTKDSFEGLKILQSTPCDLVIIDFNIPDETGDEIISHSNKLIEEVPILVIVYQQDIKYAVDALHTGAWDFVIKPIEDLGIIDITITKALEKARIVRENKRYSENLELMVYQRAEQLKFQAQLLESVRESFMAKDLRGNIIYWSKGAEELFGYSESEVLGRSILFSGNDDKAVQESAERFEYVLKHGLWHGQYKQYKKNGKEFISDVRISLIKDEKGQPQGFIGLDRDITSRLKAEKALMDSEKKYHSLFSNMREASALYQLIFNGNNKIVDTRILDVNKSYENMFHLERDEISGRLVSEISQNKQPSKYLDKIQNVFDNKIANRFETFAAPDRYFDVSVFLFDHDKVATVIEDITEQKLSRKKLEELNRDLEERVKERTSLLEEAMEELKYENEERKRAQDELLRLNEELEISRESILEEANKLSMLNEKLLQSEMKLKQANAAKDKFFSIVAHDLKNPLHSMLLTSSFLSDNLAKMGKSDLENQISAIFRASSHISDLLENLMKWSKSQRGQIEYSPEIFDIRIVVVDNINLLENTASKKGISLINNVEENSTAYFDINMVSTVVRNLISNAIKFTSSGGKIEISAHKDKSNWVVAVSDNGVGIDEKHIDRIFNIDYNFSTRGTDNETGTGLGLVLCHEFIKFNRGKIWVESEKGKGSNFYFSLPINLLS